MKLYLTNIQINYNEFFNSLKSIGYSEDYPSRISNKAQLEQVLNQLLDDILIFNDLINIFDYSKQEKLIILKRLNNIGRRKTTILHNLIQLNNENYVEDESIDMEYSDVYLFESQKQKTMNNNDFQMILNESQQQFDELKENNILKGVDKVLTAGAKILSSKNNALGRLSKSKLNEGFNIGNTKKAEAKGYKSGAKDGMKVGAVGGAAAGALAVGAGVAAYHGGKKLINKVKETFGKKKPATKKLNESLDELVYQAQQQYVDDSSLDNNYEWDFTEDELENPLFESHSKFGRRKINQQLDLDQLADQARQKHQQTVQLFESVNANNFGKPKIGVKKVLCEYREVTIGKKTMLLTNNKTNLRIVILLEYDGFNNLSDLLNMDSLSENWWIVDAYEDEDDYGRQIPEVAYCLENFDQLMK